jgi:hypothetical protein
MFNHTFTHHQRNHYQPIDEIMCTQPYVSATIYSQYECFGATVFWLSSGFTNLDIYISFCPTHHCILFTNDKHIIHHAARAGVM